MINRINNNRSSIISELNPIPSENENFHYKKNLFQIKVIVYMVVQFLIIDAFVIASVTSTNYSDYISKSVPLLTCFMAILSICILIQAKMQEFLIKAIAAQLILFFFYSSFMAYVVSFLACVIQAEIVLLTTLSITLLLICWLSLLFVLKAAIPMTYLLALYLPT